MTDLVKEVTDDFVSAFQSDSDFRSAFAMGIAAGLVPEMVDFADPRVVEIVRRCKETLERERDRQVTLKAVARKAYANMRKPGDD